MSEETPKFKGAEKRPIVVAILVFVLTTVSTVAVNSYLHKAFIPWYSISRYVGSETWNAIVFALANMLVAFSVLTYLYRVGEKWKFWRIYYWIVVAMAVGLVGLSVCPIGYFDLPGYGYATSVPSHVHEVCSRLMFLCMLLVVTMILFCKRASRVTRMVAAVYVAYGVVCVMGYCTHAEWFAKHLLLFESCYLFSFLAFCLGLQSQRKEKLG